MSQNQTSFQVKNKKSNLGTKIGALAGFTASSAAMYLSRDVFGKGVQKFQEYVKEQNLTKLDAAELSAVTKSAGMIAVVLGLVAATGIGALVGKGISKLVNHFSKKAIVDKENNTYTYNPKTIKGKDNQEYYVKHGHPKTLYRKNSETGKFEQVAQVYDGSWGKEMSDEDFVKMMTYALIFWR